MKINLFKPISLFVFVMLIFCSVVSTTKALASGEDDPLLTKIMFEQIENDLKEDDTSSWDAQAWIGYDFHKMWFKTEGEYQDSDNREFELQALYSRAIAPYWDIQLGIRENHSSSKSRQWGVIGFQGLAPYYFDIDASLFIGNGGRAGIRLSAEYEMLLTQRLILTPEFEVNFHSDNDVDMGVGSGLSELGAGLRLRYEIIREFAPYIGVDWTKKYGNTADYAREEGEEVSESRFVVGFSAWF